MVTEINQSLLVSQPIVDGAYKVVYVEETHHAVSLGEVILAIAGFVILSYYWIKVNKDKEHYQKWINPNGKEVNLYKIVRNMMFAYPVIIIIAVFLQIYLNMPK